MKIKKYFSGLWRVLRLPEMLILPGNLAFYLILSLIPIISLIGIITSSINLSASGVIDYLSGILPVEVAEILSILKNKNAKHYLKELKDIQIFTTGKDLINLGLKPSKDFKKIFDLLIDQKLKKTILSKNDELNFIKTNFLKMD